MSHDRSQGTDKRILNSNRTALKVVKAGLYSTIQDRGRFGLRHMGIPWSGVLCPAWQTIANALVGNPANAPVVECFEGGLELQSVGEQPVRVAVVGDHEAVVKTSLNGGVTLAEPNRTLTLTGGEKLLLISSGGARQAIVAIFGVCIKEHLGSSSTYAKASLGGLDGSILQAGNEIPINTPSITGDETPTHRRCHLPDKLCYQASEIRAIPGPQFDNFSPGGQATFSSSDYVLSTDVDRMGARFNGPVIAHRDAASKDIVSDAIVPGSIQIPGSGLPIVLLNDAQTAGGYPKIATVISADLPLAGLQRTGATFRFRLVSINEAIAAQRHTLECVAQTISSFSVCSRERLDSATLLQTNLIDGVTDGSEHG